MAGVSHHGPPRGARRPVASTVALLLPLLVACTLPLPTAAFLDFSFPNVDVDVKFDSADLVSAIRVAGKTLEDAAATLDSTVAVAARNMDAAAANLAARLNRNSADLVDKFVAQADATVVAIEQVMGRLDASAVQHAAILKDIVAGLSTDVRTAVHAGVLAADDFSNAWMATLKRVDSLGVALADEGLELRHSVSAALAELEKTKSAMATTTRLVGAYLLEAAYLTCVAVFVATRYWRGGKVADTAVHTLLLLLLTWGNARLAAAAYPSLRDAASFAILPALAALTGLFYAALSFNSKLWRVASAFGVVVVAVLTFQVVYVVDPEVSGLDQLFDQGPCPAGRLARMQPVLLADATTVNTELGDAVKVKVFPEGLERLGSAVGELFVHATVGKQRTGKSTFATLVARQLAHRNPCGPHVLFNTAGGPTPVTHGLWVTTVPLGTEPEDGTFVVLDMEGVGDVDRKETEAAALFSLAVLLAGMICARREAVPGAGNPQASGRVGPAWLLPASM